jgi:hypothetical protein
LSFGKLLLILERLTELGRLHLDATLVGLLLHPLALDQELHDVLLELVVLALALLLERVVRGLLLALGRRRLRLRGHALLEVGRLGDGRLAALLLRLTLDGDRHPLVELVLGDGRIAHLGDRARGHAVAAAGEGQETQSGRGESQKGVCEGACHRQAAAKGSEPKFRDLKVRL